MTGELSELAARRWAALLARGDARAEPWRVVTFAEPPARPDPEEDSDDDDAA